MNIDKSKFKNLFSWNFLVLLIALGLMMYMGAKGYDKRLILGVIVLGFVATIFLRRRKNEKEEL